MPSRFRSAVLTLACVAAACGPSKKQGDVPEPEPAVVMFTNQSQYEAAVFVVPRGGLQVRVGTVQPGRTERLLLRSNAMGAGGTLTIVARVTALQKAPTTGAVNLQPGDRVAVTLSSQADLLSLVPAPE